MKKIIFLIAPSEGKNSWWNLVSEKLSFIFEKPLEILKNLTEKDLKCKWDRFLECQKFNTNIEKWPFMEAINRYSWVVFNAIDYEWMTITWKEFFEKNVYILSWMYGIVSPLDHIWNYKLPIESKWLYTFWGDKIAEKIAKLNPDIVVNLLPLSYSKLIWIWKCSKLKKIRDKYLWEKTKIININFFQKKAWNIVKISHWVKKYRWELLKNICENNLTNYEQFWWEIVNNWKIIDINILE